MTGSGVRTRVIIIEAMPQTVSKTRCQEMADNRSRPGTKSRMEPLDPRAVNPAEYRSPSAPPSPNG